MSIRTTWIILLSLWLVVLILSVYRDTVIVNQDGFGDLRNRVVGARLIKDGKSPYWYKWQSKDSTRYYDHWNIEPFKINNITASPLFLHFMSPIADINQRNLSYYWLIIEYLVYLAIVFFAGVLLLKSGNNKMIVLLIPALLFTFTSTWVTHISVGQNYIIFSLLLVLFFYSIPGRRNYFVWGLCCGAIFIITVLFRPLLILFFVPYISGLKQFKKHFILAACIPLIIAAIWLLTDRKEQLYWKDYRASIAEQIKFHQALGPATTQIEPPPAYTIVEGVDLKKSDAFFAAMRARGIFVQIQSGSVYKIYYTIFHRVIPVPWLNAFSAIFCFLLFAAWYVLQRHDKDNGLLKMALTGFCLYFIADVLLPVNRGPYASVLWLFPVTILPSFYNHYLKREYFIFFTGFILNIFYLKVNLVQYVIGEYMMFIALLGIIFKRTSGSPYNLSIKQ